MRGAGFKQIVRQEKCVVASIRQISEVSVRYHRVGEGYFQEM